MAGCMGDSPSFAYARRKKIPPMSIPKNKPIMPKMRLEVRAWLYLPVSIFLIVARANIVSISPGMKSKKATNSIRPKNGKAMTVVCGIVDAAVEIDVRKKNAITKVPIKPAAVDKT